MVEKISVTGSMLKTIVKPSMKFTSTDRWERSIILVENVNQEIDLVQLIDMLGGSEDLIEYVDDRPGHDLRYAIDNEIASELNWKPKHTLEQGLENY